MKNFYARTMRSGKTWYYYGGTKPQTPLGSDYVAAVKKWVELSEEPSTAAPSADFLQLADRYEREVVPLKANSTQATQRSDLKHLREFFGNPVAAPIDQITPGHIRKLLKWMVKKPTTANRLKRLFSHMFNMAREWEWTERENPVAGVRGLATGTRNVDITEEVYRAVWEAAGAPCRDAMDLAYLTGQRPGDVLQFVESQLVDGLFRIKGQSKTGKPLRIKVEGEFGQLIERILARKAGYRVWCSSLCVNAWGMALTKQTLRKQFEAARAQAALDNPKLADEIKSMWFYDLRAKAAADTADGHGDQAAADLLGHDSVSTTQRHYLRRGKMVSPTR